MLEISNFRFQIPDSSPMPTFKRFEELPVWQEAIQPPEGCEDFIAAARDRLSWSKRDQLDPDSFSASDNIAEGFERGTANELLAFLYIVRGSVGEVRSLLCFFAHRPVLSDLKSQIPHLKSLAESCSRQLRASADALQNSDIAGRRHLIDRTRASDRMLRRQEEGEAAFRQLLAEYLPPGYPARQDPPGKSQI